MDGRQSSEETVTITSRSWVHIRVKNHRWQRSGGRTSNRAAHQRRARHKSRPQSEPQIARFKCTLREKPLLPILAIIYLCGYSYVQSAFAHSLHYHQHNPCVSRMKTPYGLSRVLHKSLFSGDDSLEIIGLCYPGDSLVEREWLQDDF